MDVEPAAESSASSYSGGKMDHGAVEEQEKDEDVCALFATSMPQDVWANPSLAALAAMIDEDVEEKGEIGEGEQSKCPSTLFTIRIGFDREQNSDVERTERL